MKKTALFLSAVMIFSCVAGCSKDGASSDDYSYEGKEIVGGNADIPELSLEEYPIPDSESMEFVKDMKIGWNLGNTLDATREGTYSEDSEMDIESYWSGITTTRDMISEIKNAGFNTVRIPVSWHNHLIDDEFTISKQWLDRVQEVVDYAIKSDMYAIINIHHDIDEKYYYPSNDRLENSKKYVTSIWTQICDRFGDYDNKLVFESVNEPRLTGTNYEWWLQMSNPQCLEAVECINVLNQTFVDVVRASGKKNDMRYLMVPGYAASADYALIEQFKLPNDTVNDRLIVSVHAYTPYNFALQAATDSSSTSEWTVNNESDIKAVSSFMDKLYERYISEGIPVVIGEFGARDKNLNTQSRVEFATYYNAAAVSRGMICCWWDNNAFFGSGENFGLLDRETLTWKYPDIVLGLMKYAN